jgi:aspartokinase/homoserine dehydrogenase 1
MSSSSELPNCMWEVHKFGGTSVGNANCMRACIEIVKPKLSDKRIAMVVSAMGGKPKVTDLLLDSVHAAAEGKLEESHLKLSNIREKHHLCISDLLKNCPDLVTSIINKIDSDLGEIKNLLRAVALMKTPHEQILELVSGYGEIWSATIMGILVNFIYF